MEVEVEKKKEEKEKKEKPRDDGNDLNVNAILSSSLPSRRPRRRSRPPPRASGTNPQTSRRLEEFIGFGDFEREREREEREERRKDERSIDEQRLFSFSFGCPCAFRAVSLSITTLCVHRSCVEGHLHEEDEARTTQQKRNNWREATKRKNKESSRRRRRQKRVHRSMWLLSAPCFSGLLWPFACMTDSPLFTTHRRGCPCR